MAPKPSVKNAEIWNFFNIKPQGDKIAICKMCKVPLSYKSTTNNLRKHLLRKHPTVQLTTSRSASTSSSGLNAEEGVQHQESEVEIEAISDAEFQPQSSTSKAGTSLVSQTSQPSKTQTTVTHFLHKKMGITARRKIDESLMLLFTRDFQPFSIVEDYGFKKFVMALNPSYQLPARKTITNTLLQAEYEEVYNNTKELLMNVKALTLTTDCWTSSTTENYLAVTGHFLTNEFAMKHVLLGCDSFPESHTAQNLAAAIQQILNEFNLENKVNMVISDNAANIKKAIKDVLKLKHFGCYAHTLNLIAQDSLKLVVEILQKVKDIVAYFRRSTSAMSKLLDEQKRSNIVPTKRLVQEVVTRWNSTYYMVERFVNLEEPIRKSMALINHDFPIISVEEWEFLKEMIIILKPLEDVTKTMSGENYLTGSSVIVITDGLVNVYEKLLKDEYNKVSNDVITAILNGIRTRLGDLENSNSLTLSTFLDPRFKNIAFSSEKITEKVKNAVTSLIINNEKKKIDSSQVKDDLRRQETDTNVENSIWSSFDNKVAVLKPMGTAHSRAIIELQRYLEEPPIPRKEDPLAWWKNNAYNFPHLSAIVLEKFIVVATSVPCERLFSKSGLLLSDRRNRLSSNKVKKILFLNSNKN